MDNCRIKIDDYIRYMKRKLNQLRYTKFKNIQDNLDPFINQFKGESQKYVAYKLIDLLNFYDESSLKVYIEYFFNELRRRVYVESIKKNKELSDLEYERLWDEFIKETLFVPLSDKTITDSGYGVIYKFKDYFNDYRIDESNNISAIQGIIKHINNGKKNIIIVDDFVGWGFQIIEKFLPREFYFEGYDKKSLSEVIQENENVNFEFFVLVSSIHGKNKVENQVELIFNCIDLYTDEHSILEFNNVDWISEDEFKMVMRILNEIVLENNIQFDHTMNLPILFEHSSPKPSHPIYWMQNENKGWKALRMRNK